jgi:hypothetical protein
MGTTYQTRVAVMQGVNRRRQLHASDKKTFSRDTASLAATFPIAPQENYSVPQKFFDAPRKLPIVSQFHRTAPQNSQTVPRNSSTPPQLCRRTAQIISVVPHNLPAIPRKCSPVPQKCRNAAQLLQTTDTKQFMAETQLCLLKLIKVLPHPDPLPLGEGTASDDLRFCESPSGQSCATANPRRWERFSFSPREKAGMRGNNDSKNFPDRITTRTNEQKK